MFTIDVYSEMIFIWGHVRIYAPKRFDLSGAIEEDEIVKEYKRQGLLHEEKVKDYLRTLPLKVITINVDVARWRALWDGSSFH